MISPDVIKERVQSVAQLPALPDVAMKVVEMVDNPKTSTSSLARIISTDQALTAKVLKIANSPFYGFPKKISTIDFAIIVLGYDALKEIVVSTSLINSLEEQANGSFNSREFWDHSIASGILSRRLARDLGYRVNGEVFVGGLLHDMGVSVLSRHFRMDYQRIVGIVHDTDLTFLEAEESVLGVTHQEVGGWLAERWNLPDHLVEAVAFHHTPAKAVRNPELVSLVHCGDVLACRIAGNGAVFDRNTTFDPEALSRLQIGNEGQIEEFVGRYASLIQNDLAQFAGSGSVPEEGPPNHE
jgi:HD-like signal output (HDOD) protein